jgi:hypothetical protein
MWSCFAYICDVRMCLWCLLDVVAAKSWLVPGCSPWWLPNPGWFHDPAGNRAGYCSCGRRICKRALIKARYKHWSVSNGLHSESLLQKCPQCNGQCKSPLPVLTGGPQDLARSSRYMRRRLKESVSFNREKADARANRCVSFCRDSGDAG